MVTEDLLCVVMSCVCYVQRQNAKLEQDRHALQRSTSDAELQVINVEAEKSASLVCWLKEDRGK